MLAMPLQPTSGSDATVAPSGSLPDKQLPKSPKSPEIISGNNRKNPT